MLLGKTFQKLFEFVVTILVDAFNSVLPVYTSRGKMEGSYFLFILVKKKYLINRKENGGNNFLFCMTNKGTSPLTI